MKQRNPDWPTDLNTKLKEGVPLKWPGDWSNERSLCIRCEHPPTEHQIVTGGDRINRVFCQCCPLSRLIMMGDEGLNGPSPFFLEGPIHSVACFEERPTVSKVDNFLPLSPSSQSLVTFTLQATTQDGEDSDSITLTGPSWDPSEFECLVDGDEVDKNSNRYKLHLYWLQSGRCAGCQRTVYFVHMEIDRITPGDSGPGYVVGNVQLLCSSCNKIKGDRSMEDLIGKLKKRGLPGAFNYTDVNQQ